MAVPYGVSMLLILDACIQYQVYSSQYFRLWIPTFVMICLIVMIDHQAPNITGNIPCLEIAIDL